MILKMAGTYKFPFKIDISEELNPSENFKLENE